MTTRSVVTDGAGFLGSDLCERLLREGHEVVCLDNLDTGSLQNREQIRDDAFDFRNVDVVDEIHYGLSTQSHTLTGLSDGDAWTPRKAGALDQGLAAPLSDATAS